MSEPATATTTASSSNGSSNGNGAATEYTAPRDLTVKVEPGQGPTVKTPVGDAPVIPIFLILAGAYLTWFGVKYWRGTGPAVWPSYPIKSVLQGKGLPAPEPAAPVSSQLAAYEQSAAGQISASTPGGAPGGSVAGSAIATDALRYQGAPYKWGGANPQGWDCSGFVNWVIGHDLNLAIPGQPVGPQQPPPSGPPAGGQWWILQPGAGTRFTIVQSAGSPGGNVIAGPFPSRAAAQAALEKAGG